MKKILKFHASLEVDKKLYIEHLGSFLFCQIFLELRPI